jgi:hypothetical protein
VADDGDDMTPETQLLIQRLLDGETVAPSSLDRVPGDDMPALLVARALVEADPHTLLGRAHRLAATSRDRQLVVVAAAHVAGDVDRVDALARDHLVDHPDSPVVAWIATHPAPRHHIAEPTTHAPQNKEPS